MLSSFSEAMCAVRHFKSRRPYRWISLVRSLSKPIRAQRVQGFRKTLPNLPYSNDHNFSSCIYTIMQDEPQTLGDPAHAPETEQAAQTTGHQVLKPGMLPEEYRPDPPSPRQVNLMWKPLQRKIFKDHLGNDAVSMWYERVKQGGKILSSGSYPAESFIESPFY